MKKRIFLIFVLMTLIAVILISCNYVGWNYKIEVEYEIDEINGTVTITGIGTEKNEWIYMHDEINGYPVTAIGDYAFRDCDFTAFMFSSNITSIGEGAFANCQHLLALPRLEECTGLTEIKDTTFMNCPNFSHISLPDSIERIGDYAFFGCTQLLSINDWPSNLKEIGTYAFGQCYYFQIDKIPNSVTSIGVRAFDNCQAITTLTIPSSVKEIGQGAFLGCINLKEISLPEGLDIIDDWTFHSCYALKEINIPSTVNTIGKDAFSYCKALSNIVIPEGVKKIDRAAFSSMPSLESISIPKSTNFLGALIFYKSYNLQSVNYAGTIEEWLAIEKEMADIYWNIETADFIIYCTDGQIAKDGTVTYN